jgi:GABA permease
MDPSQAGAKPEAGEPPRRAKTQRLLIVAAHEIVGEQLIESLRERVADGPTEARIVAPALASTPFKHVAGDVDEGIAEASERLTRSCERLSTDGIDVRGSIGDADPLLAIEDGLAQFPADEILIVTGSDGAHWLEGDLFDRARQRFEQPVVHVELEDSGPDAANVTEWERSEPGADEAPDAEIEGGSENMPRLSLRDLTGIAIAIVGSIAAILIAAGCDDGDTLQRTTASAGEGTDGSCVAAYIIAGVATLVNLAHVVGLMLFESVRYRGFWERFFSWLSLVGTPLAVIATIILAH